MELGAVRNDDGGRRRVGRELALPSWPGDDGLNGEMQWKGLCFGRLSTSSGVVQDECDVECAELARRSIKRGRGWGGSWDAEWKLQVRLELRRQTARQPGAARCSCWCCRSRAQVERVLAGAGPGRQVPVWRYKGPCMQG